jgi:hypothetical protein
MRLLLQRVIRASVKVEGQVVGRIGTGLLVLVGVGHDDDEARADLMAGRFVGVLYRSCWNCLQPSMPDRFAFERLAALVAVGWVRAEGSP